jgi:hypothetical protein
MEETTITPDFGEIQELKTLSLGFVGNDSVASKRCKRNSLQ